jgi:hypothetical protein
MTGRAGLYKQDPGAKQWRTGMAGRDGLYKQDPGAKQHRRVTRLRMGMTGRPGL